VIVCCWPVLWCLLGLSAGEDPPPLTAQEAATKIRWQDAADHVGQDCVVYGKIVRTGTTKNWCFLNFDEDYRRTFTVAIPRRFWDRFAKPPAETYADQQLSVYGRVIEYDGKPEIIVSDPARITVGANLPDQAEAAEKKPPPKPRAFDGSCQVATFNVLNLFDDYDDPYHGDETTPTKPRPELEHLAETIRRLDADVLALQEVENRGHLQRFVDILIPDLGYEHLVLFEGNDYRGIDVAVLSRLPVGPVTSYRHLRFTDGNQKPMSFRRDLLRVRIEPPGVAAFDVFVVHLKSKRGNDGGKSLTIRMGEAGQVRRVLDGVLSADPQAHFVICGDFNDTLDSEPLKTIIGSGASALGVLVGDPPGDDAVTFNKEPYRSTIDFILPSPAMAKRYRAGSLKIIAGSVSSGGSDHNPVAATFDLK